MKIENNILIEKHYGYNYEHCHSENWNAMKGFHYLIHIRHTLNEVTIHTIHLSAKVKEYGGQFRFARKILEIFIEYPLDRERFESIRKQKYQLRFDW